MLTAAGNINQPYATLGVIHAVVTKPAKEAGCSGRGGLPIQEAFDAVLEALKASAAKSGGDGLIHVSYDYRVSSTNMACNQSKAVIEVYGWGTVIRLGPSP
jgi:hypothetical protein